MRSRQSIPGVEFLFAAVATLLATVVVATIGLVIGFFVVIGKGLVSLVRRKKPPETAAQDLSASAEDNQTVMQPEPEQAQRVEAEVTPVAAAVAPQGQQGRSLVDSGQHLQYRGYLRWSGMKKRTDANPPYAAFCVRIFDLNVRALTEHWGVTLQPAIEAAQAEPGDLIALTMAGHEPVQVKGKTVSRKVWTVTVEKKHERE